MSDLILKALENSKNLISATGNDIFINAMLQEIDAAIQQRTNELAAGKTINNPISTEAAQKMGAKGGEPTEEERLLFEAWMKGHCWFIGGVWDGKTYSNPKEQGMFIDPNAMDTRRLWAAWRDRAALTRI